jgi:YD repeat-containing protein
MSDLDRYQYGYDQNSNRLWKGNVVAHAAGVYLDEAYSYDNLNRLTVIQRGNLSSGVITGTPTRQMDYTLDPTGNWAAYLTKTNGTTDLNQTRTANKVNEITAIGGTPAWATPPVYDAAGNMTSFPQPASPASAYTATYDAWNRMTSISSGGSTVATYQYDGRGRRIIKYTAAIAETRHFYYTNDWQDIEERVGSATTMDNQYVWGVRYVDELICRDDATATPARRLYALQDANFNLTGITDANGNTQERYLFDPYGNRAIMNAAWSTVSASAYAWAFGFQGLFLDAQSGLIYSRTRWLIPSLGSLGNRCPWGYNHRERSLYDFVNANPIRFNEPFSDPVDVGIVVVGGILLFLGGCHHTQTGPAMNCGTFSVTADPSVPISDPAQQAHAGNSAPGFQVGYTPCPNACQGGTITILQVISGPGGFFNIPPHFDYPPGHQPIPGQLPPGYVGGGGLGLPNGSPFPYGLRDAPGAGDSSGSFAITNCAACDTGGVRTILGCTDFTYDRGTNTLGPSSPTGPPKQNPGTGTWTGVTPQIK